MKRILKNTFILMLVISLMSVQVMAKINTSKISKTKARSAVSSKTKNNNNINSNKTKSICTAKVYENMPLEKKNSYSLSNGLTVKKVTGYSSYGYMPGIFHGSKKIWDPLNEAINDNGKSAFTVTNNGELFLYYISEASGGAGLSLIGVNSNGKVFLKKNFGGQDIDAKFISADSIVIKIERDNPNFDPATQPNAYRHSGIYDVTTYKLLPNGILKNISTKVEKK
ncbi:MAG: hypothetical protein N2448_10845 [Caloramator sp.]|nr:hypothetical protein [Caloramator sp.]